MPPRIYIIRRIKIVAGAAIAAILMSVYVSWAARRSDEIVVTVEQADVTDAKFLRISWSVENGLTCGTLRHIQKSQQFGNREIGCSGLNLFLGSSNSSFGVDVVSESALLHVKTGEVVHLKRGEELSLAEYNVRASVQHDDRFVDILRFD
ncbi:MAG TPA: hypothetical protein VGM05_13970 [Planctomycetaceae bacterium]|jgi:hypothetical protein